MKKIAYTALLLFAFMALAGCAAGPKITELNGVWHVSQYPVAYIDKLMIIGVTKDDTRRATYETHMAKALSRRKIETFTSSAYIHDKKDLTQDNVRKAIKNSGAKLVLVSKVVGIDEEDVIMKLSQDNTFIVTPHGTYMRTYVFAEPKEVTVTNVRLETGLYDVESEKLLWAASSTIMNPGTADEAIGDFAKAIVQQLTKDGYVHPGLLP